MPNVDGPNGFLPTGRGITGGMTALQPYTKAVGLASALFPGDLVGRAADETIDRTLTPGTTSVWGVNMTYGPASTKTEHLVIVDPFQELYAQQDSDASSIAAVDLGLNANFILGTGSGGGANGGPIRSGDEIDSSTKATTATLDLHLLRLYELLDNEHGTNSKLVVLLNNHRLHPGKAGV